MKKFMAVIGTALAAVLLTLGLFGCTVKKELKIISIPLTNEDYAFAVRKGDADLMAKANELIAEMKANGEFEALVTKYMGDDETDFVKFQNPTSSPNLDTQLVVATNAEFAPFEFMLGNYFSGVDIEIAQKLAEKVGKPLYIANMDFDAVVLSTSGTTTPPADDKELADVEIPTVAHIGMAGLTITEDRKKVVDFTDDYFHSSQMLIVRDGDTTFDACKTLADIEAILATFNDKTKIGYQNGTTGDFYTAKLSVSAVGYKNGALAAQDLQIGRIDYVIIDLKPAEAITAKLNALV